MRRPSDKPSEAEPERVEKPYLRLPSFMPSGRVAKKKAAASPALLQEQQKRPTGTVNPPLHVGVVYPPLDAPTPWFLHGNRYYSAAELEELVASIGVDRVSDEIALQRDRLMRGLIPPDVRAFVQSLIEKLEQRQDYDLVSDQDVQNSPVPGETTTPAGERGLPRSRQKLPLPETGHELTRPATAQTRQIAELLAQSTKASLSDATAVVNAMLVDARAVAEVAEKVLKRKPRLSIKDIPESELSDPTVINDAHKFANAHRYTSIATLPEPEANKLRRARLIQKYDIDRRQKTAPTPA